MLASLAVASSAVRSFGHVAVIDARLVHALTVTIDRALGQSSRSRAVVTTQPPRSPPRRIISLIPAVSEMLFAIGAGPQVVAVSSFDDYPPEVLKLPRVGALLDPDLERILSLRPDLVIVYESQTDLRRSSSARDPDVHLQARRPCRCHDDDPAARRTGRTATQSATAVDQTDRRADSADIRTRVVRPTQTADACWSSGATRSRCAASTRAAASASSTTCSTPPAATTCSRTSSSSPSRRRRSSILARRPEVILELRAGDMHRRAAQSEDRRLAGAPVGAGGPQPAASRSSPIRGPSSRGRALPRAPSSSRAPFIPEALPDEDSRLLEQRQRQRLDAARASREGSARRRRC